MSKEKKNKQNDYVPTTPEEKAFEEQQDARKSKVKFYIKRFKWYHIVAAVIVLFLILLFGIWHLIPKKVMNVAVLDKTVLAYADDENIIKHTVYRKHQGFYWILHQQRYVNPEGQFYDYKKDYFGPMLDEEGNFDHNVVRKDAESTRYVLHLLRA